MRLIETTHAGIKESCLGHRYKLGNTFEGFRLFEGATEDAPLFQCRVIRSYVEGNVLCIISHSSSFHFELNDLELCSYNFLQTASGAKVSNGLWEMEKSH